MFFCVEYSFWRHLVLLLYTQVLNQGLIKKLIIPSSFLFFLIEFISFIIFMTKKPPVFPY